jgi:4'-phosphopantetheinyl transferase
MSPPAVLGAAEPLGEPGPSFDLRRGEISVWRIFLDTGPHQLKGFENILPSDELTEAARLATPLHRNRFVVARGVRRAVLARYLKCQPAELRFDHGPHGRPTVTDHPGRSLLRFTQSRSAHLALIAVTSQHDVGIDIEQIRLDLADRDVVRRCFARKESRELLRLPGHLWPQGFFGVWTRKEAYLKATGQGLSYPLDAFEVTTSPDSEAALVTHRDDPREVDRWQMRTYWPAPNFIATVAVDGVEVKLRHFDWPRTWTS